jgi:hypothetical protein
MNGKEIIYHMENRLKNNRQHGAHTQYLAGYDDAIDNLADLRIHKWYGPTQKSVEVHYQAEDKLGYPVQLLTISDNKFDLWRTWKVVKSNDKSWVPACKDMAGAK